MVDKRGRTIDYLRVSVTDRCDLRCVYCMPEEGVSPLAHGDILSYEQILRIAGLLARLGVKKVRLTGGEPLVRKGLAVLVAGLKATEGIERVYMTTNGMLLAQQLPELLDAGLDGVNISLDALTEATFGKITRRQGVDKVLGAIDAALGRPGFGVKLNCVPTSLNRGELIPMAKRFLGDKGVSLRFIELMPIGLGATLAGIGEEELRRMLESAFGALVPLPGEDGGGPCRYFRIAGLPGRVGFISALSHCFCQECNRVRLTASGFLKTCLQYDRGVELKELLEKSDHELTSAMRRAILEKPERHRFSQTGGEHLETRIMSQIGG